MRFSNAGLQWSPYRARSSGRGFDDVTHAPAVEGWPRTAIFPSLDRHRSRVLAAPGGRWPLPGHLRERYNLLRSWMPSHHLRRCC